MKLLSFSALREFWCSGYADAEAPLRKWYKDIRSIGNFTPQSIKDKFRAASFVGNDRIVFNISGNKYRLVVHVRFDCAAIYVRFVGTHAEYDKIDVTEV